jgi:lysophospholipase L1-like esterase
MPLGDSITQGNTQTDSYRRQLWKLFQDARLDVDFVGSERDNNGGPPPSNDFDRDHEGHWGWRADEVLGSIEGWARSAQPDVVLIHLGSNDVFADQSNSGTLQELGAIVERLRAANPAVRVLLAQIIPTSRPGRDPQIVDLNAAIPALAARLSSVGSPVVSVDHYTGFDPARETRDGTHPNAAGETKMANRWFEAYRRLSAGMAPPAATIRKRGV